MRIPDFFILGAPKCGTTALHAYLKEHPGIFMPELKEPHYYATDFPDYRRIRLAEDYFAMFENAPAEALCAEASVWYLLSQDAVGNILRDNPRAKFIVMLRNPVDMVYALYWQKRHSLDEDVDDFETAWNLQDERARGKSLPHHCREPRHLLYRAACSFAPQLQRLYDQVPRERVWVIVFEEFVRQTAKAYADTLQFLDLPNDGRTDFPTVNASHARRSRALALGVRHAVRMMGSAYGSVKRTANAIGWNPGRTLERWNDRPQQRRPLDPRFQAQLAEAFRPDVEQLEKLLGRSLEVWRGGGQRKVDA